MLNDKMKNYVYKYSMEQLPDSRGHTGNNLVSGHTT